MSLWLLGQTKSSSPGDKCDCHQRFLVHNLSSSNKTNKPCSNTISSNSQYSILQPAEISRLKSLVKPLIFKSQQVKQTIPLNGCRIVFSVQFESQRLLNYTYSQYLFLMKVVRYCVHRPCLWCILHPNPITSHVRIKQNW